MHKVQCTCPAGIQLRLLGGTVYLQPGQEAVLTDVQITHSSVKTAIRNGNLQVAIPEVKVEVEAEPAPVPIPVVQHKKTPKAAKAVPAYLVEE